MYLYSSKQPEFKMEYIELTYREIENKIKDNFTCVCAQTQLHTHSCSRKGSLSGFVIITLAGMHMVTC